jgi:hypothetical protein
MVQELTRQKAMDADEVREMLIELCREAGGQAAWARRHGFTAAYVNDVIRGRRGKITVPPDILDVLQLEIDYRRKRNG